MATPVADRMRFAARLGVGQRWALTGGLVLLVGLGIGLWSALRDDQVPAYFIVKWGGTDGKCTVVTERPENGSDYRMIWYSSLRLSAEDKLKEFIRSNRCRRTPNS